MGGKPSKGTKRDGRLKGNKGKKLLAVLRDWSGLDRR